MLSTLNCKEEKTWRGGCNSRAFGSGVSAGEGRWFPGEGTGSQRCQRDSQQFSAPWPPCSGGGTDGSLCPWIIGKSKQQATESEEPAWKTL